MKGVSKKKQQNWIFVGSKTFSFCFSIFICLALPNINFYQASTCLIRENPPFLHFSENLLHLAGSTVIAIACAFYVASAICNKVY
jgi:hypothetical protein